MSDRKPVIIVLVIGAALTLAIVFALDKSPPGDPVTPPAATTVASAAPSNEPLIPRAHLVLKRPSMAVVEMGILTDRPKADLDALIEPKAAVALLQSQHCGAAATCAAVKAFLLADGHMRVEVLPIKAWNRPVESDLPRVAPTLSAADRARVMKVPYVVRVLVSGPPQPSQLPARAGFALTAALAEKMHGLVHDQVTDRLESPAEFVKRAIVAPLDQSAFRKDRIDYQFTTREGGNLRLITAGMLRYGAPDLEVYGAPRTISQRLADVLGALGEALAGGASSSPITITLSDIERVRGVKFGDSASMPPPMPIEIDLDNVTPETGDPNDVMARVIPPDGPSPEGYEDLAASFFGLADEGPSALDEMRGTREKAQRALNDVLDRFAKMKGQGAALFLEIPFPTATDGGSDPMANPDAFDFISIEITSFDATTVTGTLYEDPAGAVGVKKGDSLTRKRAEVTDYVLRLPDGGMESASFPE